MENKSNKNSISSRNPAAQSQTGNGNNSIRSPTLDPVVELSGLVSADQRMDVLEEGMYRRYVGQMSTSTIIHGQPDSDVKRVMYECGRRHPREDCLIPLEEARTLDDHDPDEDECYRNVISVTVNMTEQFTGIIRKNTNFSGDFKFVDLAAIAFRLAQAMAFYCNEGFLNCDIIRGANMMNIIALGVLDAPAVSSESGVMIARNIDVVSYQGTFVALAAAANSFGSVVYTDIVMVDSNNSVQIAEPNNQMLAMACWHGIRVILSMYDLCGCGDIIAYAIVKGMCTEITMVGHSDEGGWIRSLIRQGGYAKPFGGIYMGSVEGYVALPAPSQASYASIVTFCDSIIIASGACVQIAAPLVDIGGDKFPIIISSGLRAVQGDLASLRALGTANKVELQRDFPAFARNYIKVLKEVFGTNGDGQKVEMMMELQLNNMDCANERHLQLESIAPYYYVECTPVFKKLYVTDANIHGFGQLCSTQTPQQMNAFEWLGIASSSIMGGDIVVKLRSLRTSGLLHHLSLHPQDGLAFMKPKQYVTNDMTMKGGNTNPAAGLLAMEDFGSYVWGRGQSGIIAPAECVYTGNKMLIVLNDKSMNPANYDFTLRHCPAIEELSSMKITMRSSRLSYVGSNQMMEFPRNMDRSRTAASESIRNARSLLNSQFTTGSIIRPFESREPNYTLLEANPAGIQTSLVSGMRQESDYRHNPVVARGPARPVIMTQQPARVQGPRAGGGRGNNPIVNLFNALGGNDNLNVGREPLDHVNNDINVNNQQEEGGEDNEQEGDQEVQNEAHPGAII